MFRLTVRNEFTPKEIEDFFRNNKIPERIKGDEELIKKFFALVDSLKDIIKDRNKGLEKINSFFKEFSNFVKAVLHDFDLLRKEQHPEVQRIIEMADVDKTKSQYWFEVKFHSSFGGHLFKIRSTPSGDFEKRFTQRIFTIYDERAQSLSLLELVLDEMVLFPKIDEKYFDQSDPYGLYALYGIVKKFVPEIKKIMNEETEKFKTMFGFNPTYIA